MSQISRRQILQAMARGRGGRPARRDRGRRAGPARRQHAARLAARGQPDRRGGGQAPGLLRAGRHRVRDPARRPQHRRRGHRGLRPLRGGPGVVEPVADAGGVAGPADQVLRGRRAEASLHLLLARRRTRCASPRTWSARRSASSRPAAILLRALLAKNKIAEKDVTIVTIGADMTPLLTGQVDVVTGWLTNTTALKVLGPSASTWRCGTPACSSMRCRTTPPTKTLQTQGRGARRLPARDRARAGTTPTGQPRRRRSTCWSRSTRTSTARTSASPLDVMLDYAFGDADRGAGLGHDGPGGLAGADRAVRASSASSPPRRRRSTR